MYGYMGIYLPLHATGYDFTGPYEAAYALAHHAPLPVYNVPLQRQFNARVLHLPDGPSDFRWTPETAALLLPFGYLSYATARLTWLLLSQITLVLSVVLLARCLLDSWSTSPQRAPRPHTRRRLLGVTASLLICAAAWEQPVTDSLRLGQSTPLLLLGFALLVYGEVYERPVLAGCGLGLAILIKLFPALLLAYYLWRGKYRVVAASFGCMLLLTVLTLPITGGDLYRQFVAALLTYQNQPNAGPVNLSLYHAVIVGAAALLHAPSEPTVGPLVFGAKLVCGAVLLLFLLAHGSPRPLTRAANALMAHIRLLRLPQVEACYRSPEVSTRAHRLGLGAWAVCTVLLVEPIDWIFYYLLLLIPLAWLGMRGLHYVQTYREDVLQPLHFRWLLVSGGVAYLLATLPLPFDTRIDAPLSAPYVIGICIRPAALVVLWLTLWAALAIETHASSQSAARAGAVPVGRGSASEHAVHLLYTSDAPLPLAHGEWQPPVGH